MGTTPGPNRGPEQVEVQTAHNDDLTLPKVESEASNCFKAIQQGSERAKGAKHVDQPGAEVICARKLPVD
eukprot:7630901-Pyramimonas_sp.AAC.1